MGGTHQITVTIEHQGYRYCTIEYQGKSLDSYTKDKDEEYSEHKTRRTIW